MDYIWIPAPDFMYGKTDLYEQNNITLYFFMLYSAVMAFGRNEVAPRSNLELIFISFTMVLSAMFNAFIFGTISELVS
jgi:hypothetical protein